MTGSISAASSLVKIPRKTLEHWYKKLTWKDDYRADMIESLLDKKINQLTAPWMESEGKAE
jgi:hypothetical protein